MRPSSCSRLRRYLTIVTRLRFDARLFDPPSPRKPGQRGRPRVSGARQPSLTERLHWSETVWQRVAVTNWYGGSDRLIDIASGTAVWDHPGKRVPIRWVLVRDGAGEFEPQALLCTNLAADPVQILGWFVQRWSVEVTLAEVRRHLGVETQRQWSDKAIARTTPVLMGLFSLVTLWAGQTLAGAAPRQASWYRKSRLTFSDALASVRHTLWLSASFEISRQNQDRIEIPKHVLNRLAQAACFPAQTAKVQLRTRSRTSRTVPFRPYPNVLILRCEAAEPLSLEG
jgi:hypothetical protein